MESAFHSPAQADLGAELSFWHPVAKAADVAHSPRAAQLLGHDLVLWRDGAGVCHAWSKRCPHRGADLSMGCVVQRGGESVLQCGYHGWRFGASGQCVQVPAQPSWQPSVQHRAHVYAAREFAGMVWVCGAAQPTAFAAWPEVSDAGLTQAISGPYDVPTSAPRLVENFLDMTHFGFIHQGYLGDAEHTELAAYEVLEGESGVVVPDCSVWQPQAFESGDAARGQWVRYRYEVSAPYTARLDKLGSGSADEAAKLIIVMLNCPLNAEQTRTWFWIAAKGLNQTPEQMAGFQDTIFAQDAPIVMSQRPKRLPLTQGELHGPLDRVSAAYRRYLHRLGVKTGIL